MGDYDALRPVERRRLEAFAAAFEDVDPLDYELYAGTTPSEDVVEEARVSALEALATEPRRKAAERAIASFRSTADTASARRMPMLQMLFTAGGRSPRAEDRVRFHQALERAVVATIVWDELSDEEREVLAGPWAALLVGALEDR